jgi:hypothetical protein
MTMRRRLERVETAYWRQMVAQAAPPGITFDAILDQCIRFLTMPPETQRAEFPHYTEDERTEMQTWLPAIRRAR